MHEFEIVCLDLNTGMTKEDIETQVNDRNTLVYGSNVIIFTYDLIAPDEIKLTWKRNHPPYGYSCSDFISDWDMELILLYGKNSYIPYGEPIIAPLIPWNDGHYYSPIIAFKNLYAMILKTHNEKGKVKKLTVSSTQIEMVVKFYGQVVSNPTEGDGETAETLTDDQ